MRSKKSTPHLSINRNSTEMPIEALPQVVVTSVLDSRTAEMILVGH